MRILAIMLLLLLLAAGCAVEPAGPYDVYGPYYGPYYDGPVYGYGYYAPYYYHDFGHDFDRGHHEFGEHHGSGGEGMHAHR